jgi:ATP-dependent protease ClpP protease subunit
VSALTLRPLASAEPGTLELLVYGEIGEWGVSAQKVVHQLQESRPTKVVVRINSCGGDAFDGIAIHSALRSCGAQIECVIEGIAASAASCVAMAGRVVMRLGAMMMIHPASTYSGGDADHLRKGAEMLERVTSSLVDIYCAKTGRPRETIAPLVAAETWLTASEALELGLADEIDGSVAPQACAGGIRLGTITYPVALLPAQIRAAVPARGGMVMDEKAFVAALLALMGKDAATTMEELLASMGKLLQGKDPEPERAPEPEPPTPPAPPSAQAVPPTEAQAVAPELRAVCSLLAQAAGKATLTPGEAIVELTTRLAQLPKPVDLAIAEQRITPAEAKGFRPLEQADPDACRVALAAFAKGRVGSLTAPSQATGEDLDPIQPVQPQAVGLKLNATYEEMKAEFEAKKAAAAAAKGV